MMFATVAWKLLFSGYLSALSVWDVKTCTNPWWATTPLLVAVAGWRLLDGSWTALVIPWTVVTVMYGVHIIGAADWRLLLITLAVFPTDEYHLVLLVGAFLLLVVEMVRTGAWRLPFIKPTRQTLQISGTPAVHVIAVPTLAYLWGFDG